MEEPGICMCRLRQKNHHRRTLPHQRPSTAPPDTVAKMTRDEWQGQFCQSVVDRKLVTYKFIDGAYWPLDDSGRVVNRIDW